MWHLFSVSRRTLPTERYRLLALVPFAFEACARPGSPAVVLVVAADPQLETVVLVAALRCPVQDPVVGHQELHPPTGRGVRLVDGPGVDREGGEAEQFVRYP